MVGGMLVGAVALLMLMHASKMISAGTWEESSLAKNIVVTVQESTRPDRITSVYGTVVRVGDSDLEIEAKNAVGTKKLRFTYDATSAFVKNLNDDANTEVAIDAHELVIGNGITIQTAEPTGSVQDQHAVKVYKIN